MALNASKFRPAISGTALNEVRLGVGNAKLM